MCELFFKKKKVKESKNKKIKKKTGVDRWYAVNVDNDVLTERVKLKQILKK